MRKMEAEARSQSCLEVIAKMLILFFVGQQWSHNKVLSALSLSFFFSFSLAVWGKKFKETRVENPLTI